MLTGLPDIYGAMLFTQRVWQPASASLYDRLVGAETSDVQDCTAKGAFAVQSDMKDTVQYAQKYNMKNV